MGSPQFHIEIVVYEDGVDFAIKDSDGKRSIMNDLSMLQLDVSQSGYRLTVNQLTEKGKKAAAGMMAAATGLLPEEDMRGVALNGRQQGMYL